MDGVGSRARTKPRGPCSGTRATCSTPAPRRWPLTSLQVEPPRDDDLPPADSPRLEELGALNDLAYGTGDQLAKVIGSGEADPEHVYIARESGEAVAGLITADHEGDTSVWWVATAPEARGRGLSSGLMRHALADGRERGNDISTLQATKLGQPVYERLGYRGLRRVRDVGAPRGTAPRARLSQLDLLLEHDLALERPVHRALGGDRHQLLALLLGELLGQLARPSRTWSASPRWAGS